MRANGRFADAPDGGDTDLKPSRAKAQDAPVIMFLRQNGANDANPETGENFGWNDAPFYWPVLVTQQDITPVMFALDQRKKAKTAVDDLSEFLESIDPKDILSMTYKWDLEKSGEEGTEYSLEECPEEVREIKKTTA